MEIIPLGLFMWTAAVAHDIAHSVHEDMTAGGVEAPQGARYRAFLALALFILSALLGLLFWREGGRPLLFLALLVISFIYLMHLCIKLVTEPSARNAERFYVPGFAFFIIPSLGLIVDKIAALT